MNRKLILYRIAVLLLPLGMAVVSGCGGTKVSDSVSASSISPSGEAAEWDALVEEVMRATLLGRADAFPEFKERSQWLWKESNRSEPARSTEGITIVPRLDDQIALAEVFASSPPMPTAKTAKKILSGTRKDDSSKAVVEMLRRTEPRSRLQEAVKSQRYVAITQPINVLLSTVSQIVQGQLFVVVEVTARGVRSLWRFPYPTPREREVIRLQRNLVSLKGIEGTGGQWSKAAAEGLERLGRLARLQAVVNARREGELGHLQRSLWWYGRAKRLDPKSTSIDGEIESISRELNQKDRNRQETLQVLRGEDAMTDPTEKMLYGSLVRALVENPGSEESSRLRETYLTRYSLSPMAGEVKISEVAALRMSDRSDAARVLSNWIVKTESPSTAANRARILATDPRFSPRADFKRAQGQERSEWWQFFLTGKKPIRTGGHWTAEDGRMELGQWTRYVSPFFVTDVAYRLILLPFGWPLDHDPTLDAVGRWTPPPPDDAKANDRIEARADALYKDRRHVEAARAYRRLTPPAFDKAAKSDRKAASRRLNQIRSMESPTGKKREMERLINAFPDTRAARKAQKELDRMEILGPVIVEISRKELLSYPALWGPDALSIPPELLDGNSENQELSEKGVVVRSNGSVWYYHEDGDWKEEVPLQGESFQTALERLALLRREKEVARELGQSRRYYRVPFEVEGTAFPGFEAIPGLTPPIPQENADLYR